MNRIEDKDGAIALGISIHNYQRRRNDMGLSTLIWGRVCKTCRCPFVTKLKIQIRCHDCCQMNKLLFVTRKSILFHIRELAEINLDEAKKFVYEMECEDPGMLEGIRELLPEKVRCKNG
jgi:hypothetical protein